MGQVTPITVCSTVYRQRPWGRTLTILVFSPTHTDGFTQLFNFSWTWRLCESYHELLRDRVLVIDVSDETIRTKSNWCAKTVIFCFNGNSWFILALQWSAV